MALFYNKTVLFFAQKQNEWHWTFLNNTVTPCNKLVHWGVQCSLRKYTGEMEAYGMSAGAIVNISAMATFKLSIQLFVYLYYHSILVF